MTLAIEPMVNAGLPGVKILNDGWTVVTQDGSLSAHFEHTVLVTEGEPEILTWPEKVPSKLKVSVVETAAATRLYRVELSNGHQSAGVRDGQSEGEFRRR